MNHFTKNLRRIRRQCGFKKSDIAHMMGLEWHTYFYWEDGTSHPNIDHLIQLSEFFGISIDDFVKHKI